MSENETSELRKALNATVEDMRALTKICRALKEEASIFTLRFTGNKETASKLEKCIEELKNLIEVSNNA